MADSAARESIFLTSGQVATTNEVLVKATTLEEGAGSGALGFATDVRWPPHAASARRPLTTPKRQLRLAQSIPKSAFIFPR